MSEGDKYDVHRKGLSGASVSATCLLYRGYVSVRSKLLLIARC